MIQNEYVNLFGKKILKELVKDVIESEFYTIISDKVTVHSRQYLGVCIRYLYKDLYVKEEFLSYAELEAANAKAIFRVLLNELEDAGLELGKKILSKTRLLNLDNVLKVITNPDPYGPVSICQIRICFRKHWSGLFFSYKSMFLTFRNI